MNKKQKRMLSRVSFVLVLLILGYIAWVLRGNRPIKIKFQDSLDETAVTVDGTDYKLREVAYYIAFEESLVEEQAKLYSADNTDAYWNLHTNGQFIRISARDAAADMAVHDLLFYQMAVQNGIELSEGERDILVMKQSDFWSDLSDHQRQVLDGLSDDIKTAMERAALAQKQQDISASLTGGDYEDYAVDGTAYKRLLQAHSCQVNEDIWEHLDFGNITLMH